MSRRTEDRGTLEPMAAEKLAMAAIFLGNFAVADELASELPSTSSVAGYIAAFKALHEGKPSPEQAALAMRTALDAWKAAPGDDEMIKLNAEGFALARMSLRAQAFGKFKEARDKYAHNGVALRNLASMYRAADMPDFAVSVLRVLASEHGNNPEVRQFYYETLIGLDKEEEAQTFAEAVYARMPEDPQSVINLSRIYLNRGDVDVSVQLLQQAFEENPNHQGIRVMLASAFVRAGKFTDAIAVLGNTEWPENLADSVREVRLFAHAGNGEWQDVARLSGEGASESRTLASRFLAVAALVALEKSDQAVSQLPELAADRRSGPDPVALALNALGASVDILDPLDKELLPALKADAKALSQFAYGLASGLARLYDQSFATMNELLTGSLKGQARIAIYTLDALTRAKNTEGRAEIAAAIAAEFPTHVDVLLALASLHKSLEDPESQRAVLDKAVAEAPGNPAVLQRLAMFAVERNDLPMALSVYETMIKIAPENATILNNLAYYLLETKGDATRARDYATKALEQRPSNAAIMHTLGLAQLRLGELDAAQKNLAFALQQRPGDPTLSLDYGQLLIQKGEVEDGKNHVRSAVAYATQLGLEFPRRAEAEAILQESEAD